MNSDRLQELIEIWQEGSLTVAQGEELNQRLRSSSEDRRRFQQAATFHALLHCAAEADSVNTIAHALNAPTIQRKRLRDFVSYRGLFTTLLMIPLAVGLISWRASLQRRPDAQTSDDQSVATIGESRDCKLNGSDKPLLTGSSVTRGQRIDLASGMMQVKFASGALAMLYGPAIFDINSRNSGFLTSGKMNVNACTSGTADFSLKTSTVNAVHDCSEYAVEVALNGRTRFDVSKGTLRIYIPTVELSQRLQDGGSMELEPGSDQIVTLIESGDGTSAFQFPTIPPPSSTDLADQSGGVAKIQCFGSDLPAVSGPPEILLDGKGQSAPDQPGETLFFENDRWGSIVLDLGKCHAISMINTYSWHQPDFHWLPSDITADRAVQKYDLYGYAGESMPPVVPPYSDSGWKLIARVNTDDFFHSEKNLKRPPQQAASIRGAHGGLGSYRHLLWVVQPSIGSAKGVWNNTFYGEFDVFGE